MEYASDLETSAKTTAAAITVRRQRRHYRQKIRSLAYVNLDQDNGGIIRELSEAGIALQSVSSLRVDQRVELRFELPSPRVRVEATGRVAWTNSSGQAGLEFLDLPQPSKRQLKEWIFTQLLFAAHQTSWDTIFVQHNGAEQAPELKFSAAPRPSIRLEPQASSVPPFPDLQIVDRAEPMEAAEAEDTLDFFWSPVPISSHGLSWFVDGLVLLCAILLFSVVSLSMTNVFPTWPLGLALVAGIVGVFAALYWFLFVVWIGATPGERLARLAGSNQKDDQREEELPRFR